mmetsp:Transcript_6826/g.17175  ORF Transcript_6826/g.17175 Transcript_6826/m.17175 type:complete len:99 (-) Transcript_6826:333-629(-)
MAYADQCVRFYLVDHRFLPAIAWKTSHVLLVMHPVVLAGCRDDDHSLAVVSRLFLECVLQFVVVFCPQEQVGAVTASLRKEGRNVAPCTGEILSDIFP